MTKFQKQMLTIAAAGALTAVTALPAMAFENQFNGSFLVKQYFSNFDNGTSAQTTLSGTAATTKDKLKMNNYTDQRTRLQYTGKASDDLKMVMQLEANTKWGNTTTNPTSNAIGGGGGIDTDGLNLAVRWAYIDFNVGKSLNIKIGQQPFKDSIKGLLIDADLPMAMASYKAGAYQLDLGYSRFSDAQATAGLALAGKTYLGDKTADLYAIQNTFNINKDTKVGLAYYLNVDNATGGSDSSLAASRSAKKINTFGLFGETQMGALNLSGMAAMQAGYMKNATIGAATKNLSYHGWAANVVAKYKVGSGLARGGFLFTSGNKGNAANTGHFGGWQSVSATGSYLTTAGQVSNVDSGMMLLVRNQSMGGTNTDGYFRKPITNIALAHMGYDANITEKFYVNGNVGFAWLPASDALYTAAYSAAPNGSDFLGTEMNLTAGYKLYKNLNIYTQGAYWVLGSAFKGTATNSAGVTGKDPANPYTIRMAASYSF